MNIKVKEWVKKARKSKGITQEKLALELGFSTKASISAIETGKNNPSFEIILRISDICSYPLPYQNIIYHKQEGKQCFNIFPLYDMIKNPLKFENFNKNEANLIEIPKYIIENNYTHIEDIICIRMSGNSMSPLLPNSSILILNTKRKNIEDGKIYAFIHGEMLRIKKLYLIPNKKILLRSCNQEEYKDEYINLNEVDIIGNIFSWIVLNY